MKRVLTGLAAWLGGTAVAVSMAWLGASLVVRNTTTSTAGPVIPVISIAPPASVTEPADPSPGSGQPGPSRSPHPASPRPTASPSPPASPRPTGSPRPPSPRPSASSPTATPKPAGTTRSYSMNGGQVTLVLTRKSARLATAVPEAGWAVQTWSADGWLRVDFSSGVNVSSLIASWNGHPPSVTVTN